MVCPLCRKRSASGAAACSSCGVDFMKWLQLQGDKAQGHRKHASRVLEFPPGLRAAAAVGLAALLALAAWRTRGAPAVPEEPTSRPASPDRLSDIHARALTEGRSYGVELMRDELERAWTQGTRAISDEGLAAVAPQSGLGPPQETPLRDDEAALVAKCLKDNAWVYGSLPALPDVGAQCWAAGVGYPRRWVRQHWQPKRRSWGAYPEADAARAARFVLMTGYSAEKEQAARQAADVALARTDAAERRRALLAYYGFLAEREGALAASSSY